MASKSKPPVESAPLPADPSQYDSRVQWVRSKLESGLFVEFEQSNNGGATTDIFIDCLERDGRKNLQGLMDFLDDTANAKKTSSMIFWVETNKVVVESAQPPPEAATDAPETEPADEKDTNDETADSVAQGDQEVATDSALQDPPQSPKTGKFAFSFMPSEEPPADIQGEQTSAPEVQEGQDDKEEAQAPPSADQHDDQEENTTAPAMVPSVQATVKEEYRLCMWLQKLPDNHGLLNSVYFVRNLPGAIPLTKSAIESSNVLPKWLEIGYFSGHALNMLEQAISEVYLPLLCNMQVIDKPEADASEDKKTHEYKADFVATMQKFASQIAHTSQQIVSSCPILITPNTGWRYSASDTR